MSFVYFVQEGSAGPIKIGFSKNIAKRIAALRSANLSIRLLGVLPGGRIEENRQHERFKTHRIRGEWFHPADELLRFASELSQEIPLPPEPKCLAVTSPVRMSVKRRSPACRPVAPAFSRLPFSPSQVLVPLEECLLEYSGVEFRIPAFLDYIELTDADRIRAYDVVMTRLAEGEWRYVRRFYGVDRGFGGTFFSPSSSLKDALRWLGDNYQRTTGVFEESTLVGHWRNVSSHVMRSVESQIAGGRSVLEKT